MNNQSLLIHNNTKDNQTTAIIVSEKDIAQKTKEFLKQIATTYSPLGIILSTTNKTDGFTVAYEKDKFVIVAPNGTVSSARLYGNWDEAIGYVQKMLKGQKNSFILSQYIIK